MIKATKCRMGIEEGTVAECISLSAGMCGFTAANPPAEPCDGVDVVITPLAGHSKVRAALAAAEEILTTIEEMGKLGGCWYEWEVDGEIIQVAAGVKEALTKIREVTK